MKEIKRLEVGPRMSKAVIHGDLVYLAGIVASDPQVDVVEQTRDVVKEIDRLLALAGSDKTRIISANIWLSDMKNFAAMNSIWDAWVSPNNTPARATVQAALATPDYKVEIMVVAALG